MTTTLPITKTMSWNRVDLLMKDAYLSDNNTFIPNDKVAKLRPLFNLLNKLFLDFFPEEEKISIMSWLSSAFIEHQSALALNSMYW